MKILLAPDKFKDSLTAYQVCNAWKAGIKKHFPFAEIILQPLADGGEGSLSLIQARLDVNTLKVRVKDPLGRDIESIFLMSQSTAFIEMAAASGLTLLEKSERNPFVTSTFGTGQLINAALERGAQEIYLLMGGSATQDAGLGMAKALGFIFLDSNAEQIEPIPLNFKKIVSIDNTLVKKGLNKARFHIVTDVKNILLGSKGSTYTYALQKGAQVENLPSLEEGMEHIANLLAKYSGRNVSKIYGSGAAGGMAAGTLSLLGGTIESGFDFLSRMLNLESLIQHCDIVFTGEGRADLSSLQGKVVGEIAKLTHQHSKKLVVITGAIKNEDEVLAFLRPEYFATIDSLQPQKDTAIANAAEYLKLLAEEAMNTISV